MKMIALKNTTTRTINPYRALVIVLFLLVSIDHNKKNAAVVHAGGGFFSEPKTPVLQAAETIIFGVQQVVAPEEDNDSNNNSTNGENSSGTSSILNITMQIRILYEGPPSEFSWVLPLPVKPTSVGMGSEILFHVLEKAAAPIFNLRILEESVSCTQTVLDKERNLCSTQPTTDTTDTASTQIEATAPVMTTPGGDIMEQQPTVVLEQGSLEPYDYVIIESSQENPDSAFDWLESNGYDQPTESKAILRAYAEAGNVFLALRLKNDHDRGDIQPIKINYAIPGDVGTSRLAGIPLRLTSMSATDHMPIKVFGLGPSRIEPINYAEVMMDLTKADWLGCKGFQDCHRADHILRVRDSLGGLLASRGFVTEYAGPTASFVDLIHVNVSSQTLYETLDAVGFLQQLANDSVPAITLVQNILQRYIPNEYMDDGLACTGSAYQPESQGFMEICLTKLKEVIDFDAVSLYQELDKQVFQPANDAQAWFNSHDYMTHLYGEFASVRDMRNDAFFVFDRMLPDLQNEYNAIATPLCTEQVTVGLEIEVQNPDGSTGTSKLPAQLSCGEWYRTDHEPLFGTTTTMTGLSRSTATQLVARSFNGDGTTVIFPHNNGNFVEHEVAFLIEQLDSHAPDQTIPNINDETDTDSVNGSSSASTTSRRNITQALTALMVIPSLLAVL